MLAPEILCKINFTIIFFQLFLNVDRMFSFSSYMHMHGIPLWRGFPALY